ncbi:MAG: ATP-grasp domain-containing protein [Propionibacteriales bacterium]|nr:ATP-grasp domain-containing protein [Propionibacteriales bacterium]
MISSLLVANRGEIARRIFRSCRDAGIITVAVHSDADASALHALEADVAVRLPGDAAGDTYLRADLVVAAALDAGADAVHPGYGFLSENADFARAVIAAGLTWVGPPPSAIDAMGSKIAAKEMMAAAGVPVLSQLDPATVTGADLPVLVKASAGGGGRGMRIVTDLADLPEQIDLARAEAASAFGDPTVFCEPYLATGRHIEVQVLADTHGTVWTLGERDCSIQRRHQKVVEEAPSPFVDVELRERLCTAASEAVSAIGYVGAGTVEFLASDDGRFFFLEMNTRLQVEHPVTECVFGIDLVDWQVRIAEGARLPSPEPPPMSGHAIEVRLYAEDPAEDWRPTSGALHLLDVPGVNAEFRVPGGTSAALRLDAGFASGDVVSTHYDSMLAKVIVWAPTRAEAARRLASALARTRLHGLTTNRDLLVNVLRHPAFLAGDVHTAFLDQHGLDELSRPIASSDADPIAAIAAALADGAAQRAAATTMASVRQGFRTLMSQPVEKRYLAARGTGEEIIARYTPARGTIALPDLDGVAVRSASPGLVVLDVAGRRIDLAVHRTPDGVHVDSVLGPVDLVAVPRFPDSSEVVAPGSLVAPMPGSVVSVHVAPGDTVTAGTPLLVLEAMKMHHTIKASEDGVVASLSVAVGDHVETGAVLVVLATEGEA